VHLRRRDVLLYFDVGALAEIFQYSDCEVNMITTVHKICPRNFGNIDVDGTAIFCCPFY